MKKLQFENRSGARIGQTATHTYIAAHPFLRPYIAHYTLCYPMDWPAFPCETLSLVPDAGGCLILQYNGSRLSQLLWGASTKMVEVESGGYAEEIQIFVEFRPGGLFQLLGGGVPEVTDCQLDFSLVDGPLSRSLEEAFAAAEDIDAFLEKLDQILLSRIIAGEKDELVRAALTYMNRDFLGLSVKRLAAELKYSERHLNRLFCSGVGMTAKGYLRVLRVNQAVAMMKSGQHTLTQVAQNAGFYDQPHFIHDFQMICGVTPSVYLKQSGSFYNEPYKLQ